MNARLALQHYSDERERRAAEYWLIRLYSAADMLFPSMSASTKARWVQAKLYIGNTLPKVKIVIGYGKENA